MTCEEILNVQLERLRTLLTLLEFAQDRSQHDRLIERARTAIADVRRSRALLAEDAERHRSARFDVRTTEN